MKEQLAKYLQDAEGFEINNTTELENYKKHFLGAKGVLKQCYELIKTASAEEKKSVGQQINWLKIFIEEKLQKFTDKFFIQTPKTTFKEKDITLPGIKSNKGSRHPISIVKNEIIQTFQKLGFSLAEGPEIEDDWHNFTALNIPETHPARDMQDTFYIADFANILLRTHTSNVQIRAMKNQQAPLRIICPGRVYRNETISARAHCFFHQIEGLYIDEGVSFADLKQTLYYFVKEFFGSSVQIRFRPSYFPFTEPSAEMDISCLICKGKGCSVCKHSGWVEILGSGMVHPQLFANCNIDPKKYSGYAWGMGVERIAMLKYEIKDLRLFSDNDVRFLNQFSGC